MLLFTVLFVALLVGLAQAVPIVHHQLYVVNASSYAIVKARALDPFSNIDNVLRYRVVSSPTTGSIVQLSKVFSDYGYEPIFGPVLQAGQGDSSIVTGSGQRFIYKRPALDVARNQKWDSIYITVSDGKDNSVNSIFTFVPPSGAFVGSDFFLDNENWKIVGNKATQDAVFENFNRGPSLSNYIMGTDNLINLDRSSKVDNSLWYFQAPSKFYNNQGLAYGGWLSFTMSSFSGDFRKLNRESTPLVILECDSCVGPVSKGITLVFPINVPRIGKYSGETRTFSIPLTENEGWLKDPQNTLKAWTPATQCDVIQVLSRLSNLQILGDWTAGEESIALDSVLVSNTKAALPLCAMSRTDASICTCK